MLYAYNNDNEVVLRIVFLFNFLCMLSSVLVLALPDLCAYLSFLSVQLCAILFRENGQSDCKMSKQNTFFLSVSV